MASVSRRVVADLPHTPRRLVPKLTNSFGERQATSGAGLLKLSARCGSTIPYTNEEPILPEFIKEKVVISLGTRSICTSFLITDCWLRLDLNRRKDIITPIQIRIPFRGNSYATLLAPA